MLRRSTGTYLCCAPSIWGTASDSVTADQLGHHPDVCRDHYKGRITGLPHDLHTLEELMGITEPAEAVLTFSAGGLKRDPKPKSKVA